MVYEVARAGEAAVPVSEVAATIYNAATCVDPKHRYLVGPRTVFMYWLKRLQPDELFSATMTELVKQYSKAPVLTTTANGFHSN